MKLKFINYLFVITLLFISCSDDDDAVSKEPLLGVYTISKSVLTSDAVSQNGAASVASGTNVTAAIVTAFLSEIDCSSSADKGIEIDISELFGGQPEIYEQQELTSGIDFYDTDEQGNVIQAQ